MKLIIQIPCYNEEKTLRETLESLPQNIEGIDETEILVINDGSTDRTVEIAESMGVKVVSHNKNSGLAAAFKTGIAYCIKNNADIIVNTDGDNQYDASCIERIIKPILEHEADMVIGARETDNIKTFSPLKKFFQKLGSKIVKLLSSSDIVDAPSGFRAFSRDAALKINIFDNFTYTMETILQAKAKGLTIVSVPINVNPQKRKSKLFNNIFYYILKSATTITRMFIVYRPFRFFAFISGIIFLAGLIIGIRFLGFYFAGQGNGHIQSLILTSILLIMGFQVGIIAILADLLAINRKLSEDIQVRIKKLELKIK